MPFSKNYIDKFNVERRGRTMGAAKIRRVDSPMSFAYTFY
jgi:hypothetical protein